MAEAATREKTQVSTGKGDTATTARAYFEAVGRRDLDGLVDCWKPGSPDRSPGFMDLVAPDGVREFFGEIFGAIPDFRLEILDQVTEDDRSAVRWRATGTFAGPGRFQGLDPTGARIDLEGCDVARVKDGKLVGNDAYLNAADMARQLGAGPAQGSKAEERMVKAVNLKTRLSRSIVDEPEQIAEGVWIVRGGFPRKGFNVYFVREDDGVLMYDAGVRQMTNGLAAAGAQLGGITRILLGHSHADHRGAAAGLDGIEVWCHVDEVADAEGDGGASGFDVSKVSAPARWLYPRLLPAWDGGPVKIAGTVSEGDEVAGFKVLHFPGHAPGQIGLWRESDRLALVSDTFYTVDPERFAPVEEPRVAHPAFNVDTEQARESIRKLAALDPAAAWPGHAEPLTYDVRPRLERAASAP